MNKSEFITALQAKTGLAKADVTKLVNAYGEVVIEAVSKGEDVRLIGFGTFGTSERAARPQPAHGSGNPDPGRPRRPLLRFRQLQGSREVIR